MGSEWKISSLKDLGVQLIDCDHKTPKAVENGIPYIGIPQMDEGRINFDANPRLISEEDYVKWTKKANPQYGDIILSRRCNSGETVYVPKDVKFALGQNLVLLRPAGDKLHPEYLRWAVQGKEWWNEVAKYLNPGAIFESLKCGEIPKFKIKVPPKEEQKKIADMLTNINDKIELNRETNQTLEAMAQALFKSWFVDFDPVFDNIIAHNLAHNNAPLHNIPEPLLPHAQLRLNVLNEGQHNADNVERGSARQISAARAFHHLFPQAFEQSDEPSVGIQGWVPKGWDLDGLGSFINFSNGKLMKSTVDGLYPLYGANGIIGKTNEIRCSNAIIIGRVGAYCGAIKYCPSSFWPSDNTIVASSTESEDMLPFILYQLKYLNLNQYAGGAAQPLLNQATLKSIKVSAPSRSACNVFNKTVSEFIIKSTNLENEIHVLESLRDTLLPKLISGELRIPDAEQATEALAK